MMSIPIWAFVLIIVLLILGSLIAGFFIARTLIKREMKKNPPISTLKPNDYINNIDNENKAKEIKDDDIDEVLDINDEMFIAHKEKEKKQEEIKKEPIIQKEPSVHNEPPVYNNAEDEEPIEELDIDNHIEENKVEDKKVGEHQIEEKTHRNIVNEVKEDNTLKNNKYATPTTNMPK